MFYRLFTAVLPAAFFIISVAQTHGESGKNGKPANKDVYIHLLTKVLGSDTFIKYANEMPCDTRFRLENNGDEAEYFVKQIIDDDAEPLIIKDMPAEFKSAFTKIIRAAYNLPKHEQGNARASISGAVSFFDDYENGKLRSDDNNQRITSLFAEISAGPTRTGQAESCAASTSSTQSSSLPTNVSMTITSSASPTETNNKSFTKPASTGTALAKKSTSKVTMPSVPK
ncbi:hypothetical protein MMC29_007808, partial [Sticta canariensis]|nr:hypothetical protein [Sticta canariensis]